MSIFSRVSVPPGGNYGNRLSGSASYNEGSRLARVSATRRGSRFRMKPRGWSTNRYSSMEETPRTRRSRKAPVAEERPKVKDVATAGSDVSSGGNKEAAKARADQRERTRWNRKKIKRVGQTVKKSKEPVEKKQAGR